MQVEVGVVREGSEKGVVKEEEEEKEEACTFVVLCVC